MEQLLRYVCAELEKRNIAYMLSGSIALGAYATSRYTRDIDIVIELETGQVDELADIFAGPFYFHRPSVEEEVRRQGLFNVIDHASGQKIDFVVRKADEYRLVEFERRQRAEIWGVPCWIVSLEDLIISKLIWIQRYFSEVQARDIRSLLEKKSQIDQAYLQSWVERLRLNTYDLL